MSEMEPESEKKQLYLGPNMGRSNYFGLKKEQIDHPGSEHQGISSAAEVVERPRLFELYMENPTRLNYFVAVQITNPKIHQHVAQVQKYIKEQQPEISRELSEAFIRLSKLHLTLQVMCLKNEEQFNAITSALDRIGEKMRGKCEEELQIRGLGTFPGDKVLFGRVVHTPALDQLYVIADEVAKELKLANIKKAKEDFNPHMTIMKMSSAPELNQLGIRKINAKLYAGMKEQEFGSQKIGALQLCAMAYDEKTEYYVVEHTVSLGNDENPQVMREEKQE